MADKMKENCKYRDGCGGRDRFVQVGRSLDDLDKTLCSNVSPNCIYFHNYQSLIRDGNRVAIASSMPVGVR